MQPPPPPETKGKRRGGANKSNPADKVLKPGYNKKIGSKTTQLSTKATEIRCLQTNVDSAATLSLICIFWMP